MLISVDDQNPKVCWNCEKWFPKTNQIISCYIYSLFFFLLIFYELSVRIIFCSCLCFLANLVILWNCCLTLSKFYFGLNTPVRFSLLLIKGTKLAKLLEAFVPCKGMKCFKSTSQCKSVFLTNEQARGGISAEKTWPAIYCVYST